PDSVKKGMTRDFEMKGLFTWRDCTDYQIESLDNFEKANHHLYKHTHLNLTAHWTLAQQTKNFWWNNEPQKEQILCLQDEDFEFSRKAYFGALAWSGDKVLRRFELADKIEA